MFGRHGIDYLTKERDIIAGRYQRQQRGPKFGQVLVATGLVLVAFFGLIAARLVAWKPTSSLAQAISADLSFAPAIGVAVSFIPDGICAHSCLGD